MVEIRGVRIGEGTPKICVPIVSRDFDGIIEASRLIARSKADLVEWRADLFHGYKDTEKVMEVLGEARKILGDKPLIFTLRSAQEGGGSELNGEQAAKLLLTASASRSCDIVDVEMFSYGGMLRTTVDDVRRNGAGTIGSYHDFRKTPQKAEIISRIKEIQASGTDIAKIAVMPNSRRDVLELLDATLTLNEEDPDNTIICISMSGIGTLSRVAGEFFGSAVTFASIGEVSAPGQLGIDSLATVQDILHSGLQIE
ncbi:type I 3-dehydroquinate dehydratase [Youngiibacter fragilis]|uniref:3-dehydroquinate dehydratase n=1 Tax=Youngiibacter fragilis 232.1 TaxID=994573 RepID=V7HYQ9_9CLOT|nr:type I 3-dehydroquinate dehydratase [Youngiibacter fragilis]ETA79100.1 3-dehydroquinate dehydratase [Youngiibacter fragilis 232.1]